MQKEMTRRQILGCLRSIKEMADAKALLDELSAGERTKLQKAAIHFLIHNVFRTLSGSEACKPPRWVNLELFAPFAYEPQGIVWDEWMRFFGAKTAYVRVDTDGGPVIQEHLPKTAEAAKERKAGVHFVPFILGEVPTRGHVSIRSRDNVQACLTFFADLDYDKTEGWEKIRSLALLPSIVVETRRGWHAYWPLQAPTNVLSWVKVQTAMTEVVGGDTACITPGHRS